MKAEIISINKFITDDFREKVEVVLHFEKKDGEKINLGEIDINVK